MTAVSINVPEPMVEYATVEDEKTELMRNAMILFPYIQDETISYGKAAQILGINKIDLITLYGALDIPYFDETKEELESDIATLKAFRDKVL